MNTTQSVYQCDTCRRSIRIPSNNYGLDVIRHCIITETCVGVMRRNTTIINPFTVDTIAPEVNGLTDWTPRRALVEFTQGIPSTTWIVTHDMGVAPVIHAYTQSVSPQGKVSYTEIFPISTSIIDANTSKLEFSTPQYGVAQCIATTTAPAGVTTQVQQTVANTSIQVTNNMVLALATANSQFSVSYNVTFTSPSGVSITETYDAPTYEISQTAWSNAGRVVVGGLAFTTRAIALGAGVQAAILQANGILTNGTQVTIDVPNANSVLVLLSQSPFTTTDQITTSYIDGVNLATTGNLFYNGGDLFANISTEKRIFPPIARISS